MTKSDYFNDAPILAPEDDQFGIDPFAQALAQSIIGIKSPVGATIALNGPWGSGKSSAVNLIRHHLMPESEADKLEIIDFKCWWFRGEEALTLAFLQELNASLGKSLGAKAKELIPQLGKTLLQAGPVIGPAMNIVTGGIWGAITSGSIDVTKRFFPEGDSVEKLFQKLADALEEQDKRFLVLIDDIDRLTPDEALLVFRLVKSVGRLPNVMYLLVFDRELAEKAVKERYPSEGPHFLEKIIQASFEIPLPPRDDLNMAARTQIEGLCGPISDKDQVRRFMNIFYDAVSPYIIMPRDLTRLSNAMAVSWPPVAREVNVADYVALEVMRLFEPALYNAVRTSKDRVVGSRSSYGGREDLERKIQDFLALVQETRQEQARVVLQRLFPRFENIGYSSEYMAQWEAERLVCTEKHFDTYFRMAIGDETLSINEIDAFIDRCGDGDYVKHSFRDALTSIRKNGRSKVPLLFDEVNTHAARIEKAKFQNLISALFEIADEIDREGDREKGVLSSGDNYLRIHWLIRKLTFKNCDLDERSKIFIAACKDAELGWLVDFTTSALTDYYPREGREPEPLEKCLISKGDLDNLKAHAIQAIEAAATSGELIFHARLPNIFFRWREISEDGSTVVKAWTNDLFQNDVAVAMLAKAFTGESWSQGMGISGLGDRVSMRHLRAKVDGLDTIMNVDAFRQRLQELVVSDTVESPYKEYVEIFLDAWRKQESGED